MKTIKSKEPKRSSLIMTACSGILLGALLGVFILLTKPVSTGEKPEVSQPGDYTTFLTTGKAGTAETPAMRSSMSRVQRRTPGPVSFSEEELNYYLAQVSSEKKEEAAPAEGEAAAKPKDSMGPLNLNIEGDRMFANLKFISDPTGNPFEMVVQAEVEFENTEEGPELSIKNIFVNSMRVPNFGGIVSSMIMSRIAETEWPEEYVEMWENIRSIELESNKLIADVGLNRPT